MAQSKRDKKIHAILGNPKVDGLGRKKGFTKAMIGDRAKVSEGSGIDSGKIGIVVGRKPANEFPQSSKDWLQVKVEKPAIQKGIIISVPKDRLEKI